MKSTSPATVAENLFQESAHSISLTPGPDRVSQLNVRVAEEKVWRCEPPGRNPSVMHDSRLARSAVSLDAQLCSAGSVGDDDAGFKYRLPCNLRRAVPCEHAELTLAFAVHINATRPQFPEPPI
ncbi:jg13641 [Pararge aegeria aegeria]|uniref:Jg13641 protein n=1 Tax=Pararge aegeria aegeria TaxID=348720 RepID=A0A8S4SDW2_9NEOP|nr:jg13641 [Pararge aegeria aegeria]